MNTTKDVTDLAAELAVLRERLNGEIQGEANLRDEYDSEFQQCHPGDELKVLAAKQRLDIALSRIEETRANIRQKELELDELQGREAEEAHKRATRERFETAKRRLADCEAELTRLKAEYSTLPEKIRVAEWQFNQALKEFGILK